MITDTPLVTDLTTLKKDINKDLIDAGAMLRLMANPINLQLRLIEHLESKLLGGQAVLVDPNSVAMQLVEGFSCVTADFALAIQRAYERRLAPRAQTDADLFLHMSDYDYIGCFATPSVATIQFSIDKSYILTHGALVQDHVRAVKIPKETVITLGTVPFAIYYPILIYVDERTRIPLVTYDITVKHPLRSLESNRLTFIEQKYLGYELITITIPIYQFTMTTRTETVASEIGFTQVFNYEDLFYALRLFTTVNGKTIELHQSLVQDNYDATHVTARLQVMTDTKKFLVNIPQVYFNHGMMGPSLTLELYTTQGDIRANVGNLPAEEMRVDFKIDKNSNDPLVTSMQFNPVITCDPISASTTGGTNGYTYEEKRARVIRSSFQTRAHITPSDLENYYADWGIKVHRYEDNLTGLLYFVTKPFFNQDGKIVASMNIYLDIYPDTPQTVSSVKLNPDTSITILPSTWFRRNVKEHLATPLTDREMEYLNDLSKEDLVADVNANDYVRTPFHIVLNQSATYPYAVSYNLMQPSIEAVKIDQDNPDALAQMLAISETIVHLDEGAGGYLLRVVVKKDFLQDVPEESQHIWLYTVATSSKTYVGIELSYVGIVDDFDYYEALLTTDYWIDIKEKSIEITSLTDSTTELTYRVPLSGKWYLVFTCDSAYFPETNTPKEMYVGFPQDKITDQVVLLRQSLTLTFGKPLDDVVNNLINVTWGRKTYRTYPVDVPNTYSQTVYQTDKDGFPVLDDDGNLTMIHRKGDSVIGENGEIEYLHKAGDMWLDTDGQPVVLSERIARFQIDAPVFDCRLWISENPTDKATVDSIIASFETNFKIIEEARSYITERTMIYFKPSNTIGNATYQIGNGLTMVYPLDIKLAFKIHVEPTVLLDDTLRASTEELIIKIIEEELKEDIISQYRMATRMVDEVFYVQSVDCRGIHGQEDLQTLTVMSSMCQPSIKKKLVLTEDEQIKLVEDIVYNFVSVR